MSLRKSPSQIYVNPQFKLSPENVENLPKMAKVSAADENIQERVMDIIKGTVARGTSAKWGVYDDDLKETICDEENPHVRVLTIREGLHPEMDPDSDPTAYDVTYVYIHNNGIKPDENTLNVFNTQFFKRISYSLERATKKSRKLIKLGEPNVSRYLLSIIEPLYAFWQNPFVPDRKGEFASVLLFCKNCQFEFAVLSITYGKNDQVFLSEKQDDAFVKSSLLEDVEIHGAFGSTTQHSPIFRLFMDFLTENRGVPEANARDEVTEILKELVKLSETRKITTDDVLSYFFSYIEVPCFEWVGNYELIHGTQVMRDEYNEFEKVRKMSILKNGACTLNMALTMMQIRKRSPVFYLHNAGGVAGCKCYANAAASNDMITLAWSNVKKELQELIQCRDPRHEFKMFNSNHCIPELNPYRHKTYTNWDAQFLFIDYTTAVYMFTERNRILVRNDAFLRLQGELDDSYKTLQQSLNESLTSRWEQYEKAQKSASHKKHPGFVNDDFNIDDDDDEEGNERKNEGRDDKDSQPSRGKKHNRDDEIRHYPYENVTSHFREDKLPIVEDELPIVEDELPIVEDESPIVDEYTDQFSRQPPKQNHDDDDDEDDIPIVPRPPGGYYQKKPRRV